MAILTDRHQVTRLEIVETGRRRRWSDAKKLRIVEESLSGPRLASATARRHGLSNQLLFAWRKAYREGRLGEARGGFVPAMIVPEQPEKGSEPVRPLEIVSPNGWRVLVGPDSDENALTRVPRALAGLR